MRLLRPLRILETMRGIEGWFDDAEADLLLSAAVAVLHGTTAPRNFVEIGSYLGRSTSVLGAVVKALSPGSKVWAIDPHEGLVGAEGALHAGAGTLARFRSNMAAAGLDDIVKPVVAKSCDVDWETPIHLLFIDGLHDYANVSGDFGRFEPWLADGAYVLFHDYASYYPDVRRLVDELIAAGKWRAAALASSLIMLCKS